MSLSVFQSFFLRWRQNMRHVIFHVWDVSWRKRVCEAISIILMLIYKQKLVTPWLYKFSTPKFNTFLLVYCDVQVCYSTAVEHSGGTNCCNLIFFHVAVLSIKTAFDLERINLLFRIILLIQWSVIISIFVGHVVIVFGRLKYIPRFFSEHMLPFIVEEPMKICVAN